MDTPHKVPGQSTPRKNSKHLRSLSSSGCLGSPTSSSGQISVLPPLSSISSISSLSSLSSLQAASTDSDPGEILRKVLNQSLPSEAATLAMGRGILGGSLKIRSRSRGKVLGINEWARDSSENSNSSELSSNVQNRSTETDESPTFEHAELQRSNLLTSKSNEGLKPPKKIPPKANVAPSRRKFSGDISKQLAKNISNIQRNWNSNERKTKRNDRSRVSHEKIRGSPVKLFTKTHEMIDVSHILSDDIQTKEKEYQQDLEPKVIVPASLREKTSSRASIPSFANDAEETTAPPRRRRTKSMPLSDAHGPIPFLIAEKSKGSTEKLDIIRDVQGFIKEDEGSADGKTELKILQKPFFEGKYKNEYSDTDHVNFIGIDPYNGVTLISVLQPTKSKGDIKKAFSDNKQNTSPGDKKLSKKKKKKKKKK